MQLIIVDGNDALGERDRHWETQVKIIEWQMLEDSKTQEKNIDLRETARTKILKVAITMPVIVFGWNPQNSQLPVFVILDTFPWPTPSGNVQGITWVSAVTNPAMTELMSDIDTWKF